MSETERSHKLLLPENVELTFNLAEPGSRVAAGTLDYALLYGGLFVWARAMALWREHLRDLDEWLRVVPFLNDSYFPETMMALLIVAVFLAWWGYFLLFELLWNGQSPGKRILGLRVVQANGESLTPAASLVRNLVRAVDAVALLGIVLMCLDGRSRRLGDFAAGTLVVRASRGLDPPLQAPVDIPPRPEYIAKFVPLVHRLNSKHQALIRDAFARQGKMKDLRWVIMASGVAHRIARTMDVEPPDIEHTARFLADVVHAIDQNQRNIEG